MDTDERLWWNRLVAEFRSAKLELASITVEPSPKEQTDRVRRTMRSYGEPSLIPFRPTDDQSELSFYICASKELLPVLARQRRARTEVEFKTPSAAELKVVLNDSSPKSAADLQAVILEELAVLQRRLKGDALNPVNNFYDDSGNPRTENECRDQILIALGKLPYGIQISPEVSMPQGRRSDGAFSLGQIAVPLEVKGQWHKDVWSAAGSQLERFYVVEHKANLRGIYVALWFGPDVVPGKRLKLPPAGIDRPRTPEAMRSALESALPSFRKGDIAIVVLDLTRPTSAPAGRRKTPR